MVFSLVASSLQKPTLSVFFVCFTTEHQCYHGASRRFCCCENGPQSESPSEPAAEPTADFTRELLFEDFQMSYLLRIGMIALAMAHIKAASSRAIAVITSISFLPLAVSFLKPATESKLPFPGNLSDLLR